MNLDLVNLLLLQKLDIKIEKENRIQTEGPEKLALIDQELAEAENKVAESVARQKELTKRRMELEAEIADADEKVKANLSRQLRVKTNDEYRALLKENDYLKKTNSAREDETLQIMEQLESLVEENKKLKVWLDEQRTALNDKKKRTQTRVDASGEKKEKMVLERNNLTRDLPDNFLRLYNRVYSRRNCRAVAPVADGICQECHMSLPPQMYNELQKNETLATCPHCGRIIYWQDHADFENIT